MTCSCDLFFCVLQDSGMATLESFNINFQDNVVQNCKYGVRLSLGAGNNVIQGNTFQNLTRYNSAFTPYPEGFNPERLTPVLFRRIECTPTHLL